MAVEGASYVEALLNLSNPYFEIAQFVYQLGELFFGLPDPLTLFIGLFTGRPTLQATADIASTYNQYTSPTLKLLAMGAAASLHAGIPLSQSTGDPIFGPYYKAALDIEQGIRWSRSDPSTVSVENTTLTRALHEAGNPGSGTPTLAAIQQAWESLLQGNPMGGYPPDAYFKTLVAQNNGAEYALLESGWAKLYLHEQPVGPPPTPTPPPTPPPPKPPPPPPLGGIPYQAPDTYAWFGTCVEAIQCASISEGEALNAQMLTNVAHALRELPQLFFEMANLPWNNPITPLQEIANQLANNSFAPLQEIANHLRRIFHKLPAHSYSEKVLLELDCICTSLGNIATALTSATPNFTPLVNAIETGLAPLVSIAANMDPTDVKSISTALNKISGDQQVPAAWITALVQSGAVPAEFAALLQGTTWEQVIAEAAHIIGYLLNAAGTPGHEASLLVWNRLLGKFAGNIPVLLNYFATSFNLADYIPVTTIASIAKNLASAVDTVIGGAFGFAASTAVQAYESGVDAIDTTTEAGAQQATAVLLGRALEMGMAAHALATIPEMAYFTKNLGLNQTAAFVAELAGFREVLINTHRPFMVAKLGRPATYVYNRKYPTALPGRGEAQQWSARRIVTDAVAENWYASAGLAPSLYAALNASRYRPVSARALATLLQDQPIDVTGLTRVLQDNAYADTDVTFMLSAYEYASLKNVRNSYVAEIVTAYQHGVVADQELNTLLGNLGWSKDAINLVVQRCALARRVTLAQKVEAQVVPLVAQGSITSEQGLQQLEAAGIQPWYADLEITLATTKATIHAAKLEATAEAKALRAEQRNLTRAAIAEYQRGTINAAGLAAALAAIPLEPTLITSIVSVQEATLAGRQVHLYGKLMLPDAARLLRERVAAIEAQFKDQIFSEGNTKIVLGDLGLATEDIDALVARWAASLKKSPGAAVYVNPLTGQP